MVKGILTSGNAMLTGVNTPKPARRNDSGQGDHWRGGLAKAPRGEEGLEI